MALPDPKTAAAFRFTRVEYEVESGVARLCYRFDQGPELVEEIHFPPPPEPLAGARQQAFTQALQLLHLIAGVSYYKAGVPDNLQVETLGPDQRLAGFLQTLYHHGLAEFCYRNQISIRPVFQFTGGSDGAMRPQNLAQPSGSLLAMGGGKDSLVSLQWLQQTGEPIQAIMVGQSALIRDTARAAGLEPISISRLLAPELKTYNRAGAWNGHVPVTAINSAILLCAAILYGQKNIIFSNERSADAANLTLEDGELVNHQYSKSSRFEMAFRQIIHQRVSTDIQYFSLLRQYSELAVIQAFAGMQRFHSVFSSCNRNFHIDGPKIAQRWCRDCPKCRFTFLGLSLFLPLADVVAILGGNLLADQTQTEGYRALCGLGGHKPFECVGEIEESRAALAALARRPEFAQLPVVKALSKELKSAAAPFLDDLLTPRGNHFIPMHLLERIGATG